LLLVSGIGKIFGKQPQSVQLVQLEQKEQEGACWMTLKSFHGAVKLMPDLIRNRGNIRTRLN